MAATTSTTVVTSSLVLITSSSSTTTSTTSVNLSPVSSSIVSKSYSTRSSTGNSKVQSTFMRVKVSPGKTSPTSITPSTSSIQNSAISNDQPPTTAVETNPLEDAVNAYDCPEYVSGAANFTFNARSLPHSQLPAPRDTHGRSDSDNSTGTITPDGSPNPKLPPNAVPMYDSHTLYKLITERNEKIDEMEMKLGKVEQKVEFLQSLLHVKDSVMKGIQDELHRLQQYTRRYSVSIAGIPKTRGEKPADLRKTVEEIINATNCSTTPEDIDKLHRNGPVFGERGGNQDTIVRFKSHAAKEAFYRARKSLPAEKQHIKIRPSLSEAQKVLLSDAKDFLKNYAFDEAYGTNPPEFVFANIHGNVQVKMKKQTKHGLFIDIKSVSHLALVIARANDSEQTLSYHHEKQSSWDDAQTDSDPNSDDEMGFSLFD